VKWYDIIGVICTFRVLMSCEKINFNKLTTLLFFLFIVSPLISDIISICIKLLDEDIYDTYYIRFPEAKSSIRNNFYFATPYSLLLSFGTFSILYLVIRTKYLYLNYDKIIKLFLNINTCIAFYSIYQFIGMGYFGLPDIIPSFLDYRNPNQQHRAQGLSIEPGTYVIMLSISLTYFITHKYLFSNQKRHFLIILNIIVFFMTNSSNILVFVFVYIFYKIFVENNIKAKKSIIILLTLGFLTYINLGSNYKRQLHYVFGEKIENFISAPAHTMDSGAMRAYTNGIGYKIFIDNPLFGCGYGNSFFFMHKYELDMGIVSFGERLNQSSTPQNNISKILAEQGLFGIYCFMSIFLFIIKEFNKYKSNQIVMNYFFITIMMFLFSFSASFSLSHLFVWLNIGLGLNYIKHQYKLEYL
jgi:hypothetical protein